MGEAALARCGALRDDARVETVDLYDPDTYVGGTPYAEFARLRREDPVHWQHEPEGPGYWAVLRHEDVLRVSRDTATFSSERGSVVIEDLPPEQLEMMRAMLLVMDPPRHASYRRMVLHAFTPRMVERLEPRIRDVSRAIMESVAGAGEVEFVHGMARHLPLQVIGDLMGVPEADREQLHSWAEMNSGSQDPDVNPAAAEQASAGTTAMALYAIELARERKGSRSSDLTSVIVNAEVDGHVMSEGEFGAFFVQMVTAGNDTTRTMLGNGLLALLLHPAELALLRDETKRIPMALEEMLRWESPLHYFRRTATGPARLGGRDIAEGDKVVMMYTSANRDERVFRDPDRFDVQRDPNPHLAFGFGEHFCLGAKLARLEGRVFFEELLSHFGKFELAGDPVRQRSNLNNSLKTLPLRLAAGA